MTAPRSHPHELPHVARWLRDVRWLMAAIILLSCRTDDSFWSKTFTCDPSEGPQACGTTETGQSMTCFPAQAFGAQSFCVEACDPGKSGDDPSQPPGDGAFVCLPPG